MHSELLQQLMAERANSFGSVDGAAVAPHDELLPAFAGFAAPQPQPPRSHSSPVLCRSASGSSSSGEQLLDAGAGVERGFSSEFSLPPSHMGSPTSSKLDLSGLSHVTGEGGRARAGGCLACAAPAVGLRGQLQR